MEGVVEILAQQWQQQSMAEVFAVLFSIAYVWLAAEESIWCWPAALISTTLFVYVYWDVSLVFQMLLNAYYVVMAVVGFMHWKKTNASGFSALNMPLKLHLLIVIGGAFMLLLTVLIAQQWLAYELLYLDAGTTLFSLLATYLTVKKYLQSWVYWSVINALTIYLLLETQLYLTVVLMALYIVIAVRGYLNWSISMQTSEVIDNSAQTVGLK
ncbi:nicotinamide riboside transporter PnuC [Glaciecola sp. XM2]|jgi:nicotinamide mononucleotide transporter|uniref:nicotinamide riboside transporter PnuC n=1 Tax=Glaciecola sp. XM2 TaxID=1914931 RepID=UPI001BDEC226|nr:nicotinamide riboside transporter PnuC [Glaciecola sp. XM2]MBT1450891.1 nicotinamide riboside transporter PnuC [Glaciecola sp. XM2]